ncbi:MAG TPA: hypothetical protein PK367_03265 [Candidatus Paceibacterota bacterium]|nr:hypothetical protein [Candidatus Paceibacterota bacterium]
MLKKTQVPIKDRQVQKTREKIQASHLEFLEDMNKIKKQQLKVLADFEVRLTNKQMNKIIKKIAK